MATKTIRVDYLARVEGEGALDLHLEGGRVTSAQLKIFEPPRLFEALLRGRGFAETPDIVARICGICPIAYQMSAVHAIENAFGITVDGESMNDGTVTVRDRDTLKQDRLAATALSGYLEERLGR